MKFNKDVEVNFSSFNRGNIRYEVRYKDLLDERFSRFEKAVSGSVGGKGGYVPPSSSFISSSSSSMNTGFTTAAAFAKSKTVAKPMQLKQAPTTSSSSSSNSKNPALDGSTNDLLNYIRSKHYPSPLPPNFNYLNVNCSGVIYVHKRDDTTKLAKLITAETGIKTLPYHAGLKDVKRKEAQTLWMTGKCKLVVATIAFGMGKLTEN